RLCIPTLVMRVLLQVFSVLDHGPQVHRAVAIGQKIDAAVPVHGVLAAVGELGRERDDVLCGREPPEFMRCAALVAFRVAALKRQTREEQSFSVGIVYALRRLAQGKQLDMVLWVDGGKLSVGKRGVASGRV